MKAEDGDATQLTTMLRRIVGSAHRAPNTDGSIHPREWEYQLVATDLIIEAEQLLLVVAAGR